MQSARCLRRVGVHGAENYLHESFEIMRFAFSSLPGFSLWPFRVIRISGVVYGHQEEGDKIFERL